MEYILNKTLVRTLESSKINDIHLDLDLPEQDTPKFKIEGASYKEYDASFEGRIGFKLAKSHNIDIEAKASDIYISVDIDKMLVDNINIHVAKNTNIVVKYTSSNEVYHISKINTYVDSKAKVTLNIINLVSDSSKSFIELNNTVSTNGNLETNFIDLGGSIKVNNYYSTLANEAQSTFNQAYIAFNNIVDMNYYTDIIGAKAEGYINVSGVLSGTASKNFKGIIDFKKGSTKSIGKELEKVIMLSDEVKTKSLPILLCGEEDVSGAHAVSTGKVDADAVYYMMSRGISYEEAIKLIIKSEFDIMLNKLDENLKEEITNVIEKII